MSKFNYDNKKLRAMFGKAIMPTVDISLAQINLEAQKLAGKLSISGVQPKLSVRLEGDKIIPVAENGQFILKPQNQQFDQLPENEYLCMQMSREFGLNTAKSILLELSDGSNAYLVKRFDRFKKGSRMEKLLCEDMQQLIGGPDKYAGSYEQIAKMIKQYCNFAPLETQRFFEITIFNFAIGNGDAHRKNFSLLTDQNNVVALSPVYDMVSSRLIIPEESEQMALTVNGKRSRLNREDFLSFANTIGVTNDYASAKITELIKLETRFVKMIDESLLNSEYRQIFKQIIKDRLNALSD